MVPSTSIRLHDRLRLAREDKHPPLSQATVGRKLGKSGAAISAWEVGRTEPSASDIAELTRLYDVSADWLLGVTSSRAAPSKYRHADLARLFTVPVLTPAAVRAWASHQYPGLPNDLDRIQVSVNLPAGSAIAMPVNNDAMAPLVPAGAHVIISHGHAPVHDSVVAVDMGGPAPVIRRYVEDGGTVYLKPDNAQYPMAELVPSTQIVGRVVEVCFRNFLL